MSDAKHIEQEAPAQASDNFGHLWQLVCEYLTDDGLVLVESAYKFAAKAHEGQFRKSGEPFVMHPVEVAVILAELNMDADTIAAALLHDTVEDTDHTLDELAKTFNPTVAELVDGVTKISQIEVESLSEAQANTLRKMMMAMSHDIRVIVIKLADRLHNMRTLMSLREDRRIFKAKETMEIYAPLANRLGMGSVKWELEDLAFFYLEPQKYQQVQKMVNETREEREAYLDQVMTALRAELDRVNLQNASIKGRPKHLYSIYQKMKNRGKDFSEIYDLIALRVIVDTVAECYSSLGAVHNMWHPIPGRFKDYIAMPKNNMYQSLHTTVIGPAGRPLEIQIRTVEMHRVNEYGVAAHWRYKELNNKGVVPKDSSFDDKLTWLREMLDWQQETDDPQEFLESLKVDLFDSEIFVFTPKGEVMSLRAQSTPLDFAYAIHTEVGNRCVGAKVNGSIVPLTYTLQTGDRVEILTQKSASPSSDWLNIVKTPRARSKIRNYFARATRSDDLAKGHDLVFKEIRKGGLGISAAKLQPTIDKVAAEMSCKSSDEMMVAVGAGKLSARQVVNGIVRLLNKEAQADEELQEKLAGMGLTTGVGGKAVQPKRPRKSKKKASSNSSGVKVKGLDDAYVRLSHCCNPLPGDKIIGFITRGRGVSVHRADCPNASDLLRNPDRLIHVSWEDEVETTSSFTADIVVEAIDRMGLMKDVVGFITDAGVNIVSSTLATHKDEIVEMRFVFEVASPAAIEKILHGLMGIEGVFNAQRSMPK